MMLEGALISAVSLLAGMGIGRVWPGRRKGRKPAKPVCGCGHDLAHHEPDGDGGGSVCHATIRTASGWDLYGNTRTWKQVPCTCKQYTGPRIMDPGYVARELT